MWQPLKVCLKWLFVIGRWNEISARPLDFRLGVQTTVRRRQRYRNRCFIHRCKHTWTVANQKLLQRCILSKPFQLSKWINSLNNLSIEWNNSNRLLQSSLLYLAHKSDIELWLERNCLRLDSVKFIIKICFLTFDNLLRSLAWWKRKSS